MKKLTIATLSFAFLVTHGKASEQGPLPALFSISLDEAVKKGLSESDRLRSQGLTSDSSKAKADSESAKRWPVVSVDGAISYQTNVGVIETGPGTEIKLGDNHTYSIGPSLNWVVFDFGRISRSVKSLKSIAEADLADFDAVKKSTVLDLRVAYYRVALASEQLKLVADSLKVTNIQYADVARRFKVGSASRLDELSARREVISLEQAFTLSQDELSKGLRELFFLIGEGQRDDVSFPVHADIGGTQGLLEEKPTLLVRLDPIDRTLAGTKRTEGDVDVGSQPVFVALEKRRRSAAYAAAAASSQHFPVLTFNARSSLDYPNTPQPEKYNQNRVGAFLSIPVFEWGRVSKEVESARFYEKALTENEKELEKEIIRDWRSIQDSIKNLENKRMLNKAAVKTTAEIARLVYESYRAGRTSHLEVERADLRALEAKVEAARTDTNLLVELARQASLMKEEY